MEFSNLKKSFLDDLVKVKTLEDLENLRIKYIGRKSELAQFLRSLKDLSIEERRHLGPEANYLRNEIEEMVNGKVKELIVRQEAGTVLDVTMPGKKVHHGHYHPLTIVEDQIKHIFAGLNFSIVEGPELETEFYNFDAVNMPANHPAREMQDTFWIENPKSEIPKRDVVPSGLYVRNPKSNFLMRTQTTPMQVRYMEKRQPPLQIIVPGRVFRNEATDASHEINFYQVEGLMVGKNISLANFKFVIGEFFNRFFSRPVEIQIRPSYFPFVEPGLEVAIKWNDKWLEVMGAGMVHEKVFHAVGLNLNTGRQGQVVKAGQNRPRSVAGASPASTTWQGFAFGVGLERLAMIKYKIPDIRYFYQNDLRFIKQF